MYLENISKDDICSYLIHYHSLDNYNNLSGELGVKNIFKRIGSIQYDPLNVVGRNPNLVLQSRVKGFNANILDKLLYKDRYLVDAWDKAMSIYRTEDWQYFNRVRTCKDGQSELLSYSKKIINELKNRGPLEAKDIDLGKCKPNRWGYKNISGAALDYLFSIGKLGVYEKKNVIKKYDLIENLLPDKILNAKEPFTNDMEFYEWYILRRIGSIGIHWLRSGLGWLGYFINDKKLRTEIFKTLEKKGVIIKIKIPEINENFYIRQQDIKFLYKKQDYDNYVRFLAPLDNMLWDRLMISTLFGFQYSWEVYVPIEKRKYGYYVLPVLYQNKIIARMEPEKYEIGKPFSIKNWWWEPGTVVNEKLKNAIKNGLTAFSEYLNAEGIDKISIKKIY